MLSIVCEINLIGRSGGSHLKQITIIDTLISALYNYFSQNHLEGHRIFTGWPDLAPGPDVAYPSNSDSMLFQFKKTYANQLFRALNHVEAFFNRQKHARSRSLLDSRSFE